MYNARGVLLLALFMSCKRIKAYTIERDFSNLGPGKHFETLDDQKPLMQSKLRGKFLLYHEFLTKKEKYSIDFNLKLYYDKNHFVKSRKIMMKLLPLLQKSGTSPTSMEKIHELSIKNSIKTVKTMKLLMSIVNAK